MRITSVPAPFTFAPIMLRKLATSTTWGSFAALAIMVCPSAATAASIMFMVAPTLTTSRYISAPLSLSALAFTEPPCITISAPSARMPFICWSMGRWPMAQPPGRAISAFLYRPSSAPKR